MSEITPERLRRAAAADQARAGLLEEAAAGLQAAEDLAEELLVEVFHLRRALKEHLSADAAAAVIATAGRRSDA